MKQTVTYQIGRTSVHEGQVLASQARHELI